MTNPYEILGIKETATKDEIKAAYRDLAKKYHPDQFTNNPLKDLAEDKMREINEAYDTLMKGYSSNTGQTGGYSHSTYQSSSSYNSSYQDIRSDIQAGRYDSAERKLNNIYTKDAEWNYLMGMVQMNKGFYDSAYNFLQNACALNPNNLEYARAFNYLKNRNNGYRQQYYGTRGNNDSLDCCMNLICLDCCCECMGGDLIRCC